MKNLTNAVKKHLSSLLPLFMAMMVSLSVAAQNVSHSVSGVVVDENSDPMFGVSVIVPGTNVGTTTDFDGSFTLTVPASAKQIKFAYVGYVEKVVSISNSEITVEMQPNSQVIDEVVVIGYGVQKKDDLTGSVTAIGEKDFNQGLISSPEQLVNGKVAGVQIVNSGGSPTAGSTIRIRGGASLNASNDPLIVLDGVPMEVGGSVSGSGNFLSLINPNDIESMTVLKDA